MRRLYILQLWQQDKKLALLVCLFLIGQAFFTYKQIETLPFFNFGMYARPVPKTGTYTTYRLYTPNQTPIDLNAYRGASFLAYQLQYYAYLNSQNPIDAALQQTIQSRFGHSLLLQQHLQQQLTNSPSVLLRAQQWMAKRLNYSELSLWKENYVWVKNNFVLSTKKLVY